MQFKTAYSAKNPQGKGKRNKWSVVIYGNLHWELQKYWDTQYFSVLKYHQINNFLFTDGNNQLRTREEPGSIFLT